jgi:heme exporter protein A
MRSSACTPSWTKKPRPSHLDFTSVTFTDVSRTFGRRRALNRVSFQCAAGEIVALLGPNGAGKSTLLAIAATLLEPSSGLIQYGDQSSPAAGAHLRGRIGLLGHDLYLYPELSPRENLAFFGRLYRLSDLDARVDTALGRAQLVSRRDDPVSGFSRGMRQRLAIERALLHDPRLVLLDEPFTGLDDEATTSLSNRLGALRDEGRIIFVATHDLETIEPIVDRTLALQNGRLETIAYGAGSLRERYRRAQADSSRREHQA